MTGLRIFFRRLLGLFLKRKLERELDEEIRSHIEMQIEDNLRQGLSPEAARHQALLKFGGVEQVKESYRDRRSLAVVDSALWDLRYALRMLRRNPGFTAVAVLTLALGIGANTAIFSLASAVLWRPLPVERPGQLVEIFRGNGMSGNTLSHPDYLIISARNDTLAGMAISSLTELSFSHGGQSQMITGELVSGNYFDLLGVRPVLGRAFLPEEDRTPMTHPVAVVSRDFWRIQLGGDPQIVGKTISLNNHRYTVIGIAPAGFKGTAAPFAPAVWLPVMMIEATMTVRQTSPPLNDRGYEFAAIGRLKPDVSLAQAQAQLETLNRQLELANPLPAERTRGADADRSLKLVRARGLIVPLRPMAEKATALLFAMVSLVLLIACANVANLLLARAATRRKEIAIRLALGAGRRRLIRQLITESFLLALLGAGAGLLIAFWINRALMGLDPPVPASWNFQVELRLDAQALGFTLLLSFVTALLFGLASALQASKPDLVPALKDEAPARAPVRRSLLFATPDAILQGLEFAQHESQSFKPYHAEQGWRRALKTLLHSHDPRRRI